MQLASRFPPVPMSDKEDDGAMDWRRLKAGDPPATLLAFHLILTWREFLNFPCILHSMPHPTPRNHIRLKHSVGTRLQRAFRKTMLPPCTGRGAEVVYARKGRTSIVLTGLRFLRPRGKRSERPESATQELRRQPPHPRGAPDLSRCT